MPPLRSIAALVAPLLASLAVPDARAGDDAPLWEAPAACPDEAAFRDAVRRELGRDLRPDEAREVEARVQRRGDRLRLTLKTRAGERVLISRRCAELLEAGALFVAIALNPEIGLGAPAESSRSFGNDQLEAPEERAVTQVIDRESPGRPGAQGLPPPRYSYEAPRLPKLALGAIIELDVGTLPDPGSGVGASIAGVTGPWRFEAAGRYLFEERATVPEQVQPSARFSAAILSLRACRELLPRLRASACGGLDLGAMHAASTGTDNPSSEFVPMSAVTAGLGVAWKLTRHLVFRADSEVLGRIPGDGFRMPFDEAPNRQIVTIHEPAPVSFRTFTGLEVRFR